MTRFWYVPRSGRLASCGAIPSMNKLRTTTPPQVSSRSQHVAFPRSSARDSHGATTNSISSIMPKFGDVRIQQSSQGLHRAVYYGHHQETKSDSNGVSWRYWQNDGVNREDHACWGDKKYRLPMKAIKRLDPLEYCNVKNSHGYGTKPWAIVASDDVSPVQE